MSNFVLPANTWTEIASGSVSGIVTHKSGRGNVVYVISESEPSSLSEATTYATTYINERCQFGLMEKTESLWAFSVSENATISVTTIRDAQTILKDLSTVEDKTLGRIKVDDQPTSYEQNHQFKIFHRMIDLASNEQAVFKFTTTTDVNIMERKINLWSGGREYLVIPDTGQYPDVDALLTTTVDVTNVNGILTDSELPYHPVSGVSVIYGVLTGANQISVADDDQFPNGDAVQTDGNANRANNALLSTPNMSGVAAGQSFYLVFNSINNTVTSGHFYLQWEDRNPTVGN